MSKQTAVEYLIEQIDDIYIHQIYSKAFEQAKEMEKQQIIDARVKKPLESEWLEAQQYYNETFKNK